MKKIIFVLLALLMLCSCANSNNMYSQISEDEVLFSGPDNYSYSKSQLYKAMKADAGESIVYDILKRIALENNLVNLEELQKQADEFIETYTSMGYESYIVSYYGSIEAYKDAYVESLIMTELAKHYVTDNYTTLVAENKPVKMQVANFEKIEDAQKCIADFNNGSTFDMAAINNNAGNAPESTVYLDSDTTLVYDVKQYVNESNGTGISDVITYSTSTSTDAGTNTNETYYVVNIESRNADDFKDQFIELLTNTTNLDTIEKHYLTQHNIEYFDQDLYKIMTERKENY